MKKWKQLGINFIHSNDSDLYLDSSVYFDIDFKFHKSINYYKLKID